MRAYCDLGPALWGLVSVLYIAQSASVIELAPQWFAGMQLFGNIPHARFIMQSAYMCLQSPIWSFDTNRPILNIKPSHSDLVKYMAGVKHCIKEPPRVADHYNNRDSYK